jgi:DNA-binding response OmpR family regulator
VALLPAETIRDPGVAPRLKPGGDVPLSQREFILLGHLIRHAGEVCSRDQSLADLWGYSFDPGSNVVDVCVGRLRAKVERELIETVRNVGYSFVAS